MTKQTKGNPFTRYQIAVVSLLALTQFSVVLDFMVMSPLGDILMKSMKMTPSQFGVVVSSYALSAGFSGFLTASFADKFDRKKLLLFFYTGFIIGTMLCGLSNSYEFLVFSRIITGIFGGVISSISLAIVADVFDFNQRGRVMGFIQMGFGISQILGIPISLFLANQWNWQAPFYLIVALSIVIFGAVYLILKPVTAHLSLQRANPLKHMWNTIKNKQYRIGFIATAFMSLGGYLMMPWGSAFAVNNVGIAQDELPLMFMIVGLITFAVMPLIGFISDRINKFTIFAGASILMAFSILIYSHLQQTSFFILVVVNGLMMMGIMARMIPSQALTASLPEMQDRGAFMSINSSLQQMAGGIAAMVGGTIVLQKSETSPLERFDLLGYLVIVIILINIFLTYRVYKFIKTREHL
ncbi:MAG: MFS transporter [Crocinitomicaceae bacterium]|jgi:predicted MFS family arabinose efflux permease|nr:MFS transporter [Crocinitomicaceae bacterium]MCF8411062.1 MFS transporter [Crocinitomicaceae bacterium]MCF8444553.1 MFS transporter [Crocinitomicaceae bacterium]